MTLSSQLLWNYWSIYHETWYVDRTSYGVLHIGRKFWFPHFCGSWAPWNLENIRESTNNVNFFYKWNNCKRRRSRHQTSLGITCYLFCLKLLHLLLQVLYNTCYGFHTIPSCQHLPSLVCKVNIRSALLSRFLWRSHKFIILTSITSIRPHFLVF